MNLLMCSVGRRAELLKDFRRTMGDDGRLIATDNSCYAPALYFADKQYIVPKITDDDYIDTLLQICRDESISAIATFIDPEIEILSRNRERFEALGALVLVPYPETARLCFDKYLMYQHLKRAGIPTVETYESLADFQRAYAAGEISFPVFVKPRTGSGSVGARRVGSMAALKAALEQDSSLIVQKLMTGTDLDADVYVDTYSGEVVSAFSKKKISTTIGGANKTISFYDERLVQLIKRIAGVLRLYGPNDMDFFFCDGQYYLSEINPRFGGAYLHAYGAGVDFIKLIANNVAGRSNEPRFSDYDEGVVMMMYDSVVIRSGETLAHG